MTISKPIKRRFILAAAALLFVAVFVFIMLRAGPLAPVKVVVAQAHHGSFAPEVFGIGVVEARRSWMIGPTMAGRVLSVKVDVGEAVKAGQLLAEMDPVDIDQRLAALEAAIERAKSTQLAASAQQADATAKRELAASNMRRNQDLAKQSFISQGALEARQQEQASADASLQAAQANAAGTAQDLNRAKADMAALLQQRASVRLLAPADGVVIARDAEPGSTVVAGQAVLRVIDPASLWLRLRVDQARSAGITSGLRANIALRSSPAGAMAGRVARVELLSDSVTEERIVQIAFDQVPLGLAVGDMAEATIGLPPIQQSTLVPMASLQRRGAALGVWRMEAGQPAWVPVQVGASSLDGQAQVLRGIRPGDAVVVYSQKPLTAGMRVQVVDGLVKAAPPAGAGP